jgi:hypothetical protein
MKSVFKLTAIAALAVFASPGASAKTSCEEVMAKIEAKIQAKGVKAFTLTIVDKDEKSDLRVVGTCDGGSKKILYKRGKSAS